MFLVGCFRQSRPVIRRFRSAAAFHTSVPIGNGNGNQSPLTRHVLAKADLFIDNWVPHSILRYFKNTVMNDSVPVKARMETGEALLNMLFRKQFFDEAFQILNLLRSPRRSLLLSAPTRAKALTVNFIHYGVWSGPYFHNLERLFRNPQFLGERPDDHFLDVLHILVYAGTPVYRLDKVVQIYIGVRGKDYRLNSSAVAIMVLRHLEEGNEADAEHWLDYHSQRPASSRSKANTDFCLPYTVYASRQLSVLPDKEPREVYGPILERMARDQAWPDAEFINALISAELRHDNLRQVLTLYRTLRLHASEGVYPDEKTYSKLFSAALAAAKLPKTNETSSAVRAMFPKARRQLFREMARMQLHLKHGRFPFVSPIISEMSLGPALKMFIECRDYAAAIVALKLFERLHIRLDQEVVDTVIEALVFRCKAELAPSADGTERDITWADLFLDLRGISRKHVRHVSDRELRRRVISIGRRTLVIAEARERETAQTRPDNTQDDPDVSEINKEESVRRQKQKRMRKVRFDLIDVLVSRALEAKMLLEGYAEPDRAAREELRLAFSGMIPTDMDVKRDWPIRRDEDRTDMIQDPEPEPDVDAPS